MDNLLLNHGDVDMTLHPDIYRRISHLPGYVEAEEIMIHYTVTDDCAFNCRGCINALTASTRRSDRPKVRAEKDLERDIKGIAQLIRDRGKDQAVIVYYGGEPMLLSTKWTGSTSKLGTAARDPDCLDMLSLRAVITLSELSRDILSLHRICG